MLNIKSGSILTNGLGGPAYNLLIFGPVRLYIEPLVEPTPTPTVTPITPTPTPTVTPTPIEDATLRPGIAGYPYEDEEDEEPRYYKIKLTVKITKRRSVTREFIVDKHQKDVVINRLGKINTVIVKFKVYFKKIKRVFTLKWKK
jgi:hypothetical protein